MGKIPFRQIHLDYHNSEFIDDIAIDFNKDKFVETLKKSHVNSVTCFAKCCHGMFYYNTKKFTKHPALKIDLLKEQIEICHENDIKVPIYLTVGWDSAIENEHPEWLQRKVDGTTFGPGTFSVGWRSLCFNTPFVNIIWDQIKDILETFGDEVDGLFLDIIQQNSCHCEYCTRDMIEKGLNPEDDQDRRSFANKILEKFKRETTSIIKSYKENCSIIYNSGNVDLAIKDSLDCYSHIEVESLPSGEWGYEHFPISIKYAKNLGKECMGMTGRFHKNWGDFGGYKNEAALQYECFRVMAQGAAISVGDQLHPRGELNSATYELIGKVYEKVEKLEEYCVDVTAISEIGVLHPQIVPEGRNRPHPLIMGGESQYHPAIKGVFRMLSENHYQYDIIDAEMDFTKYKLLILPDIITLNDKLKEKIEDFLSKGGKLFCSYYSGMSEDKKDFVLKQMGISFEKRSVYDQDYVFIGEKIRNELNDKEYVMYENGFYVKEHGCEKLASIWNPYFNRTKEHFCSHVHAPVDKDSGYPSLTLNENIIYCVYPIFEMYEKHATKAYKQMVINCLDLLLEDKLIDIKIPTTAEIQLNYQKDKDRYLLNVLHYIPQRKCFEFDTLEDVIPLYNIPVKIKLNRFVKKIYNAQSGNTINYSEKNGYIKFVIPEINGYEIIVIEL